MISITLTSNTGQKRTVAVKTGWEDITVAEYIAMQGKPEAEVLTILTGLDAETLAALDTVAAKFLSGILEGFAELPEETIALDIESETIGQYETAKGYLKRLAKEHPATYTLEAMPILYGLYKAEPKDDKWNLKNSKALAEAARDMPVSEVAPVALHILNEIGRVVAKEADLAEEEQDPDMEEAGAAMLEGFGFYPTLNALAGGDILKQKEVMQLSVRNVHSHLLYLKIANQVQKNLQELKKETA